MEYLVPLIGSFKAHANPEKANWMKQYMKGKFEFLGLETKIRRSLQKDFYKSEGYPAQDDLFQVVFSLWKLPAREYQYCAVELLQKFQKKLEVSDITHIEKLILTKSWWDSVDGLASWICGAYFQLYPEQVEKTTTAWIQSGNFWLQRSCLLFQLKYKDKTDTDLLERCIGQLHDEKEFFIRKAIGWILREYSKTNPDWVRAFVHRQHLSALSKKEATKYL